MLKLRFGWLLLGVGFCAGNVWGSDRPNILIIYTDDQGYGDASCLNPDSRVMTPQLDRLAREGIRFTDAHSSDTVCTPSRYGLLTGRYSWRTHLKRGVFTAERPCLISQDRLTIAGLLKQHGYATAMTGKWHLGMDFPGTADNRDWQQPVLDMPLDKGFDYFYGIPASMNYGILAWFEGRFAKVPPTQFTAKKPNDIALSDYRIMPPYQSTPALVQRQLGKAGFEVAPDFHDQACLRRFTDAALRWLEQHQSKATSPFFLYVPYTSPHKPVIPQDAFQGRSKAGAYGDFLMETDSLVGELLDWLDAQQIADDTLVLFTSDNGPETTWRQRKKRYGHASNGDFREGKRSVYEGGHRVPFFVRWPKGIQSPGRAWDRPVCQTDVLATIADLLGVALPNSVAEDSESFLPVLQNESSEWMRGPMVHHAANGRFAVRAEHWKLVMPHKLKAAELYDLASDPGEANDVAAAHLEVVQRLTADLTQIVCQGRSRPGQPVANDTGYWPDLSWLTPDEFERQVDEGRLGTPVPASQRP